MTKSDISLEYTTKPSQPTKPVTSSALEQLTRSEVDALRQKKKHISDCYRKAIEAHVAHRMA